MTDPQSLVRQFHKAMGLHHIDDPAPDDDKTADRRYALIREEAYEVGYELLERGGRTAIAHELADLAYVVYGTAEEYGIDLGPVIEEIHRANMSKLDDQGQPIKDERGKVLKGPNYTKPDVAAVLERSDRMRKEYRDFERRAAQANAAFEAKVNEAARTQDLSMFNAACDSLREFVNRERCDGCGSLGCCCHEGE